MKKIFLIAFVLLILILFIFFLVKKDYYHGSNEGTGGSYDRTNHKAAKIIESKEITSFKYTFVIYDETQRFGRETLYNNCTFSLIKEDEGARCIGSGYGRGSNNIFDFEFMAPLSALDGLQILIDKHQVASTNGINRGAIGIPGDLGASLSIDYASGEDIFASDNRGSLVSNIADYNIYDFFIDLAMEEDMGLIESGDPDWELYKLLHQDLKSADGKRTLKFNSSEIFYYEGEELLETGDYYLVEADDHIQVIINNGSFGPYLFFTWEESRFFGIEFNKNSTEFFPVDDTLI